MTAVRWGLIIGVLNAAWLYLSFWVGLHTSGPIIFQAVPAGWLVLSIACYIPALRAAVPNAPPQRADLFRAGAIMAGVAAVCAAIAQVGYYTVIHPEWPSVMVEQTRAYFSARGADAAEVERRVAAARVSFTLPRYAASSAIAALVLGMVITAINGFWRRRQARRVAGG